MVRSRSRKRRQNTRNAPQLRRCAGGKPGEYTVAPNEVSRNLPKARGPTQTRPQYKLRASVIHSRERAGGSGGATQHPPIQLRGPKPLQELDLARVIEVVGGDAADQLHVGRLPRGAGGHFLEASLVEHL